MRINNSEAVAVAHESGPKMIQDDSKLCSGGMKHMPSTLDSSLNWKWCASPAIVHAIQLKKLLDNSKIKPDGRLKFELVSLKLF